MRKLSILFLFLVSICNIYAQQFAFSSNETVNKFFKELYVVSTNKDFTIDELYINSIARRYTNPSSGNTYWGITFVREGSEKALHHISYETLEGGDVLEVDLSEDNVVAKLYAVVDWSAIEEGTLFTTGQNIPLKYWDELKFSPLISAYLNINTEVTNVKFIDSNQYAEVFKELYIDSFENKIYHKEEGKSVNTYLEDIPLDKVDLQIISISRNVASQSTGNHFWNIVFNIKIPEYKIEDGKYYIVKDYNGEIKHTTLQSFYFNIYEEKSGVIDEYISYNINLRDKDNNRLYTFTYRMRLYAVIDWSKIGDGTSIYFYPRNILESAYEINNSPQIKEYIEEKESYLPIQLEANTALNLTSDSKIMLYGASLCSDSYPWFKEWLERYTGAEVINAGNPGWNAKQLASTDYYNKVESINPDVIYVMLGGNDKGDDVGTFGAISSQLLVDEIPLTESWRNAESGNKEYKFIQCLDYILRKLKSEYYDVNDNPKEDKRFPYIVVGTFPSQHREGWQFIEFNNPQNWLNKRNAIVECANKNNLPCIDVFSNIGIDWDKEPYYNQDLDYDASTGKPTLANRGIYTLDGLHLNEYGFEKLAKLLSNAFTSVEDNKLSTSSIKVTANNILEIAEYYGKLRIVNLAGQVIKDLKINGFKQIILPKGVYIIITDNFSQKIII